MRAGVVQTRAVSDRHVDRFRTDFGQHRAESDRSRSTSGRKLDQLFGDFATEIGQNRQAGPMSGKVGSTPAAFGPAPAEFDGVWHDFGPIHPGIGQIWG